MINQQLIDYVKNQLQVGVSREVVKNALIESGWSETDIQEAMNKASGSGGTAGPTLITSDIFQPKGDPIFDPKKPAAAQPAAGAKAGPVVQLGKPSVASQNQPVKSVVPGMSKVDFGGVMPLVKKYGVAGVLVVILVAAGFMIAKLSGGKSDLSTRVTSLEEEQSVLSFKISDLLKEKTDLEGKITMLQGENQSLSDDLSIFKLPESGAGTTEVTVTVRGAVHGNDKAQYSVVTVNGATLFVKNYRDPKVANVLKSLVGSAAEISGTHIPGSRDITVTSVNGTAIQ